MEKKHTAMVISWPRHAYEKAKHLNGKPPNEAAEWLLAEAQRVKPTDPKLSWNMHLAGIACNGLVGNDSTKVVFVCQDGKP